jgi:hexulose-6-phosphate isomerase
MQRRNFIKKTVWASGTLALPLSIHADTQTVVAPKPAAPFKKSIMWGTVGLEGSVADKCKAIKAVGYDGIQPDSHMNRQEVLDALKATGLEASSVCCSTQWQKQLSSPDAATRKEGMDGVIVALEDAKAYGTNAILLVPGTVDEQVGYDECWNRSTACIKTLLPIAEKLKIKIGIENVWNNFLLSPMEACRYVDQFNSDYVGFYFDCGNVLMYGWPEQWLRILGSRTLRVHVKEFSKKKADKEGRWAGFDVKLTDGDVAWEKVMAEARKSYHGGWLTTEQGNSKTLEELTDLSQRLDKILAL